MDQQEFFRWHAHQHQHRHHQRLTVDVVLLIVCGVVLVGTIVLVVRGL